MGRGEAPDLGSSCRIEKGLIILRTSKKLGLWLPEGSDPLEVSKLSENFEKLDPMGASIEAVKIGMGAGGLFMVSKYYKKPIENALLCNGGSALVDSYPELFGVIGQSYGGAGGYDNVNSAYGITAALGYPDVYNRDRDVFIATIQSTRQLVIYRKGASPVKSTPLTDTFWSSIGPQLDGLRPAFSFGRYVFVRGMAHDPDDTYGVARAFDVIYNLDTDSFSRLTASGWSTYFTNAIDNPVASTKFTKLNKNIVSKGDYLYSSTGLYLCRAPKDITAPAVIFGVAAGFTLPISGTSMPSTWFLIQNYDDESEDTLYAIGLTGGTRYWMVIAIDVSGEPVGSQHLGNNKVSVIAAVAPPSGWGSTNYPSAAIIDGYCVIAQVVSRALCACAINLNSPSTPASVTLMSSVPSSTPTPSTSIAMVVYAKRPEGVIMAPIGATTGAILKDGKLNPISLGVYPENNLLRELGDPVVSNIGAIEGVGIKNFTLPSITVSEALVYIRTKEA